MSYYQSPFHSTHWTIFRKCFYFSALRDKNFDSFVNFDLMITTSNKIFQLLTARRSKRREPYAFHFDQLISGFSWTFMLLEMVNNYLTVDFDTVILWPIDWIYASVMITSGIFFSKRLKTLENITKSPICNYRNRKNTSMDCWPCVVQLVIENSRISN